MIQKFKWWLENKNMLFIHVHYSSLLVENKGKGSCLILWNLASWILFHYFEREIYFKCIGMHKQEKKLKTQANFKIFGFFCIIS